MNETNKQTNKQSSQGGLYDHGTYDEMKAFFTVLQPQIASDYIFSRFNTITLLAQFTSGINIWPKTDKLFSIFQARLKIFLSLFTFRDIAREDSQDLRND